jgi:hypothetical protein
MHQTQRELFDVHGPLESLEGLQVTLDAWRMEYNTHRPHQSLPMAFADSRFTPALSALELRIPAQLAASTHQRSHRGQPRSAVGTEPAGGGNARTGHRDARPPACGGGGPGGSAVGELVDRLPAGLTRPRAIRAAEPSG